MRIMRKIDRIRYHSFLEAVSCQLVRYNVVSNGWNIKHTFATRKAI
jgi:hypothetical protein